MKDLIGMLDSGVGGISVLKSATKLLPNENFLFFGDNANAPYGPRPVEEIVQLSERATERLLEREVKAIVIACNTATAAYAHILRERVTIPVIGMEPAIKPASFARSNGIVLALATKATLSLGKFERLMRKYGEGVVPVEGKGLVEIVESGMADSELADWTLRNILEPYIGKKVEGIVLGCTHYPFLAGKIRQLFPEVPIFDGREGTARQLKRRLAETGTLSTEKNEGTVCFETSGGPDTIELMKKLYTSPI